MPRNKAVLGLTCGMILGGALGYFLWVSTGEIMYWIICMTVGLSIGLILGVGQQDLEAATT